MTAVAFLPPELWISVALDPYLTQADHRSLVLVNSYFYDIFTPILYSNIQLSIDDDMYNNAQRHRSSDTSNICATSLPIQGLLARLDIDEELRSYIRHFRITKLQEWEYRRSWKAGHPDEPNLMGSVLSMLAQCPNLQTLHLTRIQTSTPHIYQLITRPGSTLSLKLHACIISGEPKMGATYNVDSLDCTGWNIRALYPVIFGDCLTRLSITGDTYGWLAQSLEGLQPASQLLSLKVLHIKILSDDIIRFFNFTPNVTELQIKDIARDLSPSSSWSSILPNLSSFQGPSRLIPRLLPGRNVTDLSSWHRDWNNMIALPHLGNHFGSKVPVLAVKWSHSFSLTEFLDYLYERNPEVEELSTEGTVHYLTKVRAQ